MQKQVRDPGQEELLKEITTLLQKAQIPYMITGALSAIFYGRPRASHDIDFVIEADLEQTNAIIQAFQSLPHNEFVVQESLIKDAIARKYMFNVLHLPTMLKLDFFLLKNEAFDQTRFQRRKTVSLFGQKMYFASPEDTILKKLLWYREAKIEKHLIDAAFVYQIQKDNLNIPYLQNWARKHKTQTLLKKISEINLEQHY